MQSLVSYSWPRYCAIFVRYPRSIYLFRRVANDLVIGSIFLPSLFLSLSFFILCVVVVLAERSENILMQ